jgi:hypothetical protein
LAAVLFSGDASAGGTIALSGRVTDRRGNGVCDSTIVLSASSRSVKATSDPEGRYQVSVEAEDATHFGVDVSAPHRRSRSFTYLLPAKSPYDFALESLVEVGGLNVTTSASSGVYVDMMVNNRDAPVLLRTLILEGTIPRGEVCSGPTPTIEFTLGESWQVTDGRSAGVTGFVIATGNSASRQAQSSIRYSKCDGGTFSVAIPLNVTLATGAFTLRILAPSPFTLSPPTQGLSHLTLKQCAGGNCGRLVTTLQVDRCLDVVSDVATSASVN